MDGCVPDSIRYVPGCREVHVSAVVASAATSVEKDCTRGPCAGAVPSPPPGLAIGQVTFDWAVEWSGGAVVVLCVTSPRPPPTWPTITSDVGTLLLPNVRPLVKLMVRPCPVGTVITTGDHPVAKGFDLAHVAVEPPTMAPQL